MPASHPQPLRNPIHRHHPLRPQPRSLLYVHGVALLWRRS